MKNQYMSGVIVACGVMGLSGLTQAAITLGEFGFNPDGAEYVILNVTGTEDLADYDYEFGGGTLPGGTASLSDVSKSLTDGSTIVISRLPQFAFDLVHAVDSSAVTEFIYNSNFDLSTDFQFELTNTASAVATDYSVTVPSGNALCCIFDFSTGTPIYVPCDRPLTANNSFVSTGTPSYVPEPSSALMVAMASLALFQRRRRS